MTLHPFDLIDDTDEPLAGWPSLAEMVAEFFDDFDNPL